MEIIIIYIKRSAPKRMQPPSHLSRSYNPSAFRASELDRIPSTPPRFFSAGAAHMSHAAAASRASSRVATVVLGGSLALSAEKVGVDAVIICSEFARLIGFSSPENESKVGLGFSWNFRVPLTMTSYRSVSWLSRSRIWPNNIFLRLEITEKRYGTE